MKKEKEHKIVITVSDSIMELFEQRYNEYCDVMEVSDESLEYYLGVTLVDALTPKNEDRELQLEMEMFNTIKENPGISPAELFNKLGKK